MYRYQGLVEATVSNPTYSERVPGTTGGRASGEFFWQLDKENDSIESRVKLVNNASITGNHYATRNRSYSISSPDVVSETNSSPITTYVTNPNDLKGKNVTYSFSY